MPRLHLPGYPGRFDSDGRRMRFRRHDGIYQSDVGSLKTKPEPNIASRQCSDSSPRTRREDQRSRPIVSMSSGRLFLDRVGRHQSPSSLHRRDQIKLVARSEGTIYHRTVTSALTGCLTFRDKPRDSSFHRQSDLASRSLSGEESSRGVAIFPALDGLQEPASETGPLGTSDA